MGVAALLSLLALGPFVIAFGLAKLLARHSGVFETIYVMVAVLLPVLWFVSWQNESDAFSRAGTALILPFLLLLMTIPAWAGAYFARPNEPDGLK
jgi:RsiW-degrading membrane proteinase PrsW (M82 family)